MPNEKDIIYAVILNSRGKHFNILGRTSGLRPIVQLHYGKMYPGGKRCWSWSPRHNNKNPSYQLGFFYKYPHEL